MTGPSEAAPNLPPFGPRGLLRRKLDEKRPLIGMGITTPLPAAVEIAGRAGFEYVFIDLEHTAISLRELEGLIRAAELCSLATIVRVEENSAAAIRRVLELGADAVKVPHVNSGSEAAAVVRRARFAPEGERGSAGFVRAAGYSADWPGWLERANQQTCVDVMIEDVRAVERLDEILAVPGVDIVSFGQYDYSVSLGIPGQVDDPRIAAALARIVAAADARGQAVFTIVLPPTSVEAALELARAGVRLLTFGNEITHLHGAFRQIAEGAKEALR